MMSMRPFQIVLIGVFALLAIGGFTFLALFNSTSNQEQAYGQSVVIWGTLDQRAFNAVFAKIRENDDAFHVVEYIEKDERTFDSQLTTAIAEGRAPDLVVLPHTGLVTHRAKLMPITFETLPQRTFRDRYVDGAEIFMFSNATYGLPFGVDPMVMYWNRDVFSSSGVPSPPETWEALVSVTVPQVTRTNTSLDILQSAVALGEYRNIRHAKDILSMLLLQAGSSIVDETRVGYEVTLARSSESGLPPANATLSFYTQFSLPSHDNYSWNRAFEEDHLQFLAGELGLYFGPGSEYRDIEQENPNLNFDLTAVPQGTGVTNLRNYGTFYAFSVPRGSDNVQGAYRVAQLLASADISAQLTGLLRLAPVQRSVIAQGTNDPYRRVLYDAALISRGWLDPDPEASNTVFRQMVEDVTSGRARIHDAVDDMVGRLELLF